MPKVLLKRRFAVNCAGVLPTFIGIRGAPAAGALSKFPHSVTCKLLGKVALEANAGRSLKMESPFRSLPAVILNGGPELATRNGLARKPWGREIVPPKNK